MTTERGDNGMRAVRRLLPWWPRQGQPCGDLRSDDELERILHASDREIYQMLRQKGLDPDEVAREVKDVLLSHTRLHTPKAYQHQGEQPWGHWLAFAQGIGVILVISTMVALMFWETDERGGGFTDGTHITEPAVRSDVSIAGTVDTAVQNAPLSQEDGERTGERDIRAVDELNSGSSPRSKNTAEPVPRQRAETPNLVSTETRAFSGTAGETKDEVPHSRDESGGVKDRTRQADHNMPALSRNSDPGFADMAWLSVPPDPLAYLGEGSNEPPPRFVDTGGDPFTFVSAVRCSTSLLFPFMASRYVVDTGAVLNPSLTWHGVDLQGEKCTVDESGQGSLLTMCEFQLAHGYAFRSDGSSIPMSAEGYISLVLRYQDDGAEDRSH